MQTPITGGIFASPTFHFNLKEHSVDCAKKKKEKKGEQNKKILNAAGFALSQCLAKLQIKVSRGGLKYLCGLRGSVYLK